MASWAVATVAAWSWWLAPGQATSTVALIVNSSLLAIDTIVLPLWFFFWIWRMKRPDASIPVPDLRVALIVTKAPSEPWPLVRATLEAMLGQDCDRPYDTWLADEQPDATTRAWCRARGVRVSTRAGVRRYQRDTWPRRARCKEGNLAYFYDRYGYDGYDVVVQLDADHVPAATYLQHMVRPFADPLVGYVAAPSICDNNVARSWSARGRLYAEAVLHGPTQAGHSGGYAPSCIGSHYAVRTCALRQAGGLGPELAEDFTTTLMLSSHGWQGVFAIDAEAHGDGPATLADCFTQEFQWSRSMMTIMLGISRRYWRGLSTPARIRLGFCQLWYPLFGLLMLASVLIPVVAIVTRTPFMRVSLGSFYWHFAPSVLMLLMSVLWLRSLTFLRPRTAHAVSWEAVLFQLVRWPWALLGCGHAIAGQVARREFAFKVTPKGGCESAAPLSMRVVSPYLMLALFSAAPFLLRLDAGPAHGYRTLALLNVGLYLFAATAIVVLHVCEHPPALRRAALGDGAVKLGVTVATATVIAIALLAPARPPAARAASGTTAAAWTGPAAKPGTPTIGVTTDALAKNSTSPWRRGDLGEVNAFEQVVRAHVGIVQWFADWAHNPRVDLAQLRAIAARGSVPEISWEPWDYTGGLARPQPRYTLRSIYTGAHDAYIRTWARGLRAYGHPVLLRFAHEMNGGWYPWGRTVNSNHPGEYKRAWRHVHDLFRAAGVRNVQWVWSPVARNLDRKDYPGDAYVDIVGLSGFNGGTALNWTGWRSFSDIFDGSLRQLQAISHHSKPVQISEVASAEAGGDKATWIHGMFIYLRSHRAVRSVLWFDLRKQTDWRVTSSAGAARAFAAELSGRDATCRTASGPCRTRPRVPPPARRSGRPAWPELSPAPPPAASPSRLHALTRRRVAGRPASPLLSAPDAWSRQPWNRRPVRSASRRSWPSLDAEPPGGRR